MSLIESSLTIKGALYETYAGYTHIYKYIIWTIIK